MRASVFVIGIAVAAASCGGGGSSSGTPTSPSGSSSSTFTVTIAGTLNAAVGATSQLTATVRDSSGATVSGATVTWSSSDNSVISVSGTGLATAVKIGPATITASSNGASSTATFSGTFAPYTFDVAAASVADQRIIYDSVQFAHSYFSSAFGRTIANPTTVTASLNAQGCATGGSAAFTGAGAVTFCVGNPGWLQPSPTLRQKITMHEIFHVLQFEMRWLGGSTQTGAEWIVEGSAELVGFRALAAKGPLPFNTALGCMVKEVSDFASQHPPGLSNLNAYEGPVVFRNTQGPLYSLSMIGMDRLSPSTLTAVKAFGDAMAGGSQYPVSFQTAFGQTTAQFYNAWSAYLASLPVPPTYLCGS